MCLGPNFTLHRNSANQAGVSQTFDRILSELSVKMKRLNIDRAELTCLKAIILFNPGNESDILVDVAYSISIHILIAIQYCSIQF